jgi:ArsR family transcriptional regulator
MAGLTNRAEAFATIADRLRAMGHPTRLMILALLSKEQLHVGELAARLGCSIAVASYHLKSMERCHLLYSVRDGRHVTYEIEGSITRDLCAVICRQVKGEHESPPEEDPARLVGLTKDAES